MLVNLVLLDEYPGPRLLRLLLQMGSPYTPNIEDLETQTHTFIQVTKHTWLADLEELNVYKLFFFHTWILTA
jgi:hypothetical protein